MKSFGKYRTSREGYILVNKKGRVYYDNVRKLKAQIDADPDYTQSIKDNLKGRLDALVKTRHRHNVKNSAIDNKQLTDVSFLNKVTDYDKNKRKIPRLEKMIRNLGYTPAELAAEYNLDESKLLDEANWTPLKGSLIFNDGMGEYELVWTYTGSVLKKI